MSIEALRAALLAEGRERAAEIRRAAEQQAVRVRADAESALARHLEEALRECEERVRRTLAARVAAARREARARVLSEREALLDTVFALAQRALPAEPEDDRVRGAFEARLAAALAQLEGEVVVQCPPPLVAVAERVAARRAGVRVEPEAELAAGFRARSEVQGIEIDASLPHLLAAQRPQQSIALLKELRAQREGPGA